VTDNALNGSDQSGLPLGAAALATGSVRFPAEGSVVLVAGSIMTSGEESRAGWDPAGVRRRIGPKTTRLAANAKAALRRALPVPNIDIAPSRPMSASYSE
jgi:hypothetical protein